MYFTHIHTYFTNKHIHISFRGMDFNFVEWIYTKKILSFCGFQKPHPHIDESIIRIGFKQPTEKSILIELLVSAASKLEVIFNNIANDFQQTE